MAVVYRHRRLDNNSVVYVGIGKQEKRAYQMYKRNVHWTRIYNKYGIKVEIIQKDISWEDACDLEKLLIASYGTINKNTGNLVNMADGGEGVKGCIVSKETREKMRAAKLGTTASEETRKKMGIKSKNRIRPKMTEAQKLKLSIAHMGKKLSVEHRKKIGKPQSEEKRKRISESLKEYHKRKKR